MEDRESLEESLGARDGEMLENLRLCFTGVAGNAQVVGGVAGSGQGNYPEVLLEDDGRARATAGTDWRQRPEGLPASGSAPGPAQGPIPLQQLPVGDAQGDFHPRPSPSPPPPDPRKWVAASSSSKTTRTMGWTPWSSRGRGVA